MSVAVDADAAALWTRL
jgi:hypothetical protein